MSCRSCNSTAQLKSCSRCLTVQYCSKECQISDWSKHKLNCRKHNRDKQRKDIVNGQTLANKTVSQTVPLSLHELALNFDELNMEVNSLSMNISGAHFSGSRVLNDVINVMDDYDSVNDVNYSQRMISKLSEKRDNMLNNNIDTFCDSILNDMKKFGFCVIDNFLDIVVGEYVLMEVKSLYNTNNFKAGQVVNSKANSRIIRGDRIVWVEGNEKVCVAIGFLMRALDTIVMRCNRSPDGCLKQYNIMQRSKAMIACYPGRDSGYVRHIDNPNLDGRCITSIYYLNKDYNRERDGGSLRIYPQSDASQIATIDPIFNRAIFFWSDRRNPHEVMPAKNMRFAITVWYFDADERRKALESHQTAHSKADTDLCPF